MLALFFIPRGRRDRMAFWRATAIIGIAFQLLALVLTLFATGLGLPPLVLTAGLLLLLAVTAWAGTIVGIQRLHDRDRTGWWMLLAAIPLIGTVWHLVANGCLIGTPGPNRYGVAADGVPAVADVFGDGSVPATSRARPASLAGTLALWLVFLVVTAVTVLLFQDPNKRSEASHQSLEVAPGVTFATAMPNGSADG